MDPANPYMNTLYNVVSAGDTAQISKEAARAYRMLWSDLSCLPSPVSLSVLSSRVRGLAT